MVPVGMLGAASYPDVLDDDMLVTDVNRTPATEAVVELLGDRPDNPDLVALIGETGE